MNQQIESKKPLSKRLQPNLTSHTPWSVSPSNNNSIPALESNEGFIPQPQQVDKRFQSNYQFRFYSPLRFDEFPLSNLPIASPKAFKRQPKIKHQSIEKSITLEKNQIQLNITEVERLLSVMSMNRELEVSSRTVPLSLQRIRRNKADDEMSSIGRQCIVNAIISRTKAKSPYRIDNQNEIRTQNLSITNSIGSPKARMPRVIHSLRPQKPIGHQEPFGRRIYLLVVKDLTLFFKCYKTMDQAPPDNTIKIPVFIMNSKRTMFLNEAQREDLYKYLSLKCLSYAFRYEDLVTLANAEVNKLMHRMLLQYLSDESFSQIFQGFPTNQQMSFDYRFERENLEFFDNCPSLVYATSVPMKLDNQEFRSKPFHKSSDSPVLDIDKNLNSTLPLPVPNDQNRQSYIRNIKIMKTVQNRKLKQYHQFLQIFKIDNPTHFYELLFQCQNIFLDYSKQDLISISYKFFDLCLHNNQKMMELNYEPRETQSKEDQARQYYVWLIQHVLILSFTSLVNYSIYLRGTSKQIKQLIFRVLCDDSKSQIQHNSIKWRNFVKFHYYFIDFRWGLKEKCRFIELYLKNPIGEIDQVQIKHLVQNLKKIDSQKAIKFQMNLEEIMEKFANDPLLKTNAVLTMIFFENHFSLDAMIKTIINYVSFK